MMHSYGLALCSVDPAAGFAQTSTSVLPAIAPKWPRPALSWPPDPTHVRLLWVQCALACLFMRPQRNTKCANQEAHISLFTPLCSHKVRCPA